VAWRWCKPVRYDATRHASRLGRSMRWWMRQSGLSIRERTSLLCHVRERRESCKDASALHHTNGTWQSHKEDPDVMQNKMTHRLMRDISVTCDVCKDESHSHLPSRLKVSRPRECTWVHNSGQIMRISETMRSLPIIVMV
jgi:hypothetical protein